MHRSSIEVDGPDHEPILARDEVDRLLGMLEPRQADVVRLYHLEFLNYRDIGKKLGIEENSVGPILSRARRRLQAVVGSEPV